MIAIENVRWKDTEVVRAQEQSAALRWSTARQHAGKTPYDLFCVSHPEILAVSISRLLYTSNRTQSGLALMSQ
jgi:hypothetical protein